MDTVMLAGGRQYYLEVPAAFNGKVLIAFAGGGQTVEKFQQRTGFSAFAASAGFAIAWPRTAQVLGVERKCWNALNSCCGSAAAANVDDATFVAAMGADLDDRLGNPIKFYTGGSNGGILVYYLLRVGMLEVAGASVVGACPSWDVNDEGQAGWATAVPLLVIHGTKDTLVPYAGGMVNASSFSTRAIATAVVPRVVAYNGCLATPIVRRDPGMVLRDYMPDPENEGSRQVRYIEGVHRAHNWYRDDLIDCSRLTVEFLGLGVAA